MKIRWKTDVFFYENTDKSVDKYGFVVYNI